MIKYLQRNKEWIFSGCGVVLLVFVGQFIWRHLPTHQKSSPPSPALASSQRSQAAESSPLSAATPSPFVTPIPSSPVTFAEVIRVASDTNLTELQKDEFRRKHQGKIVEWTVRVLSVQSRSENLADSDFSVVSVRPRRKILGKWKSLIIPAAISAQRTVNGDPWGPLRLRHRIREIDNAYP